MNSAPGTMPSILLVEDDRISAAFLSAALATLPARVHVAEDCAQALAASGPFDAWLIDANLPDGSGAWLLQHLRETDAAASALAHTADATAATRDALLQAGFAEVLIKPLSAQALVDALRAALRGGSDEPHDAADWDDRAALTALAGNPEHVASVRQLFLSELPTTRSACLAAFDRGDSATLRAQLHRLQASCGFVGAARLEAAVKSLQAAPDSDAALDGFDAAAQELLSP